MRYKRGGPEERRLNRIAVHAPVRFIMDTKGRPGPWVPLGWTLRGWRRARRRRGVHLGRPRSRS